MAGRLRSRVRRLRSRVRRLRSRVRRLRSRVRSVRGAHTEGRGRTGAPPHLHAPFPGRSSVPPVQCHVDTRRHLRRRGDLTVVNEPLGTPYHLVCGVELVERLPVVVTGRPCNTPATVCPSGSRAHARQQRHAAPRCLRNPRELAFVGFTPVPRHGGDGRSQRAEDHATQALSDSISSTPSGSTR